MSIAVSAAATSAATSASTAARQSAKRAECKLEMPGFTDASATIEQKQGYAECVRALHPEDNFAQYVVGFTLVAIMAVMLSWLALDMLGSPISRWLQERKER